MKKIVGLLILLNAGVVFSQPARLLGLNFTHFSERHVNHSSEFSKLVPEKFLKHPDLGIMPFDGPPGKGYIELVNRRDEYSRYFVKENSNGAAFIQQKASGPINYTDSMGWWREISYRLGKKSEDIFVADNQPTPISIDLKKNIISIKNSGFNIQIENPELLISDLNGKEYSIGKANLADYTCGDDGIKILNFYPGIDLVYSLREGEIETSFILNKKLSYQNGNLILRQHFVLPANLAFNDDKSGIAAHRDIFITDSKNIPFYSVDKGFSYDNSRESVPLNLQSAIKENNTLEFYIPLSWLNEPSTEYPVMIDPVIRTQNTLPLASIPGTKFSPVCWSNSCDYFMTVVSPPGAIITGIYHSFEYYATGLCYADDGGYSIDYLACHTPAGVPGVYTNSFHFQNAYFTADTVLIPEFNACFPAQQCAPLNLDFTLHFYRCNHDPDTSCSGNCIRATKPWIMFVEGQTLDLASITSAQQICQGSIAQIVASAQYGIGPYSFIWTPGNIAGDTLNVAPVTTTTYTVTVTDVCGTTATGSSIINVTPDNNPGFTVTPNPACENVQVTLNGNGAGAATDYDWILPGSNAPGNAINDTQAPIISYPLAGTFDAILVYTNGSCQFNDTVSVTVNSVSATSVTLSAQPPGAICQGDTVTFHATPINGGPSPLYDWIVDGVTVQSGTTDSLVTNALNNGSSVIAVLHSNSPCSNPAVDSSTIFISVANALSPSVTISPDTLLCPGSPLTLNASAVNGGITPSYQWFANGVPVPGATSSSYSFNFNPPDTVFSVQVNSSLSCVTTPVANDSTIVSVMQNVQPVVTVSANPPGIVCAGDSVHYSAQPLYGGTAPQYLWFVNGIQNASTDSVLTILPNNNDSISVQLTSNFNCLLSANATGYIVTAVSPSVSPSVALAASPSTVICQGDTINFTASGINAGSTPVYSWSVNGIPSGINDSLFSSSTLNNNDRIQVILHSSLNCAPVPADTDFIIVSVLGNVSPSINISSPANAICAGNPVQFIATINNGGPAPVYEWFLNGVPLGLNSDTVVLNNLNSGDSVRATLTSSLGCVLPSTVSSALLIPSVLPNLMPQINITASPSDTICIGQQVQLNASLVNGGSSPSIQWFVNSIPIADTSDVLTSSTFGQGDVIVANMLSNANCLLQPGDTSNFIRIVYHQPLNMQVTSSPPDCPGSDATITANISGGSGGPYHIIWSNGSVDTNTIVITTTRNSKVIVEVSDNCTLQPATIIYNVPVLTGPVADFSYVNPAPGSFLNTLQFINQSSNADSWTWYFPDSTTSTDLNPLHSFPKQGTYDVMLLTQNNDGCTDSVLYHVSVQEDIAIYYPNSFTPNGDGRNDEFQPLGASLEDYEMTIWNRWGEMIYKGNSKMAWNGSLNNSSKPAPEGVYVFRIDLLSDKFDKRVVTGRVTLIR